MSELKKRFRNLFGKKDKSETGKQKDHSVPRESPTGAERKPPPGRRSTGDVKRPDQGSKPSPQTMHVPDDYSEAEQHPVPSAIPMPDDRRPEPQEVARRKRRAAESILDNESLTGDLDDRAAKQLIHWGIRRAEHIASRTVGQADEDAEETMYQPMRATRRLMRSANKWVAGRAEMDAELQAAQLDEIIDKAATAYGEDFIPPDETKRREFLSKAAQSQDASQVMADLLDLLGDLEDRL